MQNSAWLLEYITAFKTGNFKSYLLGRIIDGFRKYILFLSHKSINNENSNYFYQHGLSCK